MNRKIAVIRGDGIGPEIVAQAVGVLNKVAELYGHSFSYADVDMGGCAICTGTVTDALPILQGGRKSVCALSA